MQLTNEALELRMDDTGMQVVLVDRARGQQWALDDDTRLVARGLATEGFNEFSTTAVAAADSKVHRLEPGAIQRLDDATLACLHPSPAGNVRLLWILESDRVRVIVDPDVADAAGTLALPGTFRPLGDPNFRAAVPNGQGILHTGKGPAFFKPMKGHGHWHGINMAMFGQLAGRGGLLSIAEMEDDAWFLWEKSTTGRIDIHWMQAAALGRIDYRRETVLMPTDSDLTPLCKAFRRYEIAKGRFKTWDQKIAERPALDKLFGAAMVFLGYFHDDTLDYAENLRRLKALGIDRAYVWPTYMYSPVDPSAFEARYTDLRDLTPLLHELGYASGSFIYIMSGGKTDETPDSDFTCDDAGRPVFEWEISGSKWYKFSGESRRQESQKQLAEEHQLLDAVHFDVLGCTGAMEDHCPAHPRDCRADVANRRAILRDAADRGKIVSTEGFWGRMTDTCDIGSVKYAHVLGGEEYVTVPMTMLVYHDSAIHAWWEVDNYSNYEHRAQFGRGQVSRFALGGGDARLMSAIDALQGLPPDIFPFGLQYGYVPHNHPQIYCYRCRLEDPQVREAIGYAKPVMELHRRVGKLEIMQHILHRSDGGIQETVFADGTRVVANYANIAMDVPDVGVLPPVSWRML